MEFVTLMEISKDEFELLRQYINRISGLSIADHKEYLIQQRLEPLVLAAGCRSFGEFYRKVVHAPSYAFNERIINAITTNETSFFRDIHPFITLRDYILKQLEPHVIERKNRMFPRKGPKLRVLCAGSSSGQEPYSIAMVIDEFVSCRKGVEKEDFGILAVDISTQMLATAMAGEYTDLEVQRGVSQERRSRYFQKKENKWIIKDSIRTMVEFRQINLAQPFALLGGFDIIFCRNVLIYFNDETKSGIMEQFSSILSDIGYLILGTTENVYNITNRFRSVNFENTMIYKKVVNETNP